MTSHHIAPLLLALGAAGATRYRDNVLSGVGPADTLSLISYAARSLGESSLTLAEPDFQTLPMLFSGGVDGLIEGLTWAAYWTQNSYGTAMTTLPFLSDLSFKGMRESQRWWFEHQSDGTAPYGSSAAGGPPSQGWAPDGCLCDDGTPANCNYKQGDGTVPLHDWTLEESLSAVVMQAELLLVGRNLSAAREFLPHALRMSNLIEGRRDPASGMTRFLSGPSSNLLAPSFGGWTLDNGVHAWSWMTGISVTYAAALLRLIEVCNLVGDAKHAALYTQRLELTRRGLDSFLAPEGDYFVRSLDPNGTAHGVLGAARHGYFEASPNHDAVAFRVVNDSLAAKIVRRIEQLGLELRPNVFILPNTDATGKPPVAGAGGIGYDDMICGDGATCGGIWEFGTWVNGGVWTTTEGRWLLAAARLGDISPALDSVRQMRDTFASSWRMDNPLVDFGRAPYQPEEDINLVVDNFASAGGLLRGLFEYLYSAADLTLIPHQPDNVTSLELARPVRWGPYALKLSATGVRSSGMASVRIDGEPLAPPHTFNATHLVLEFAAMPTASAASLEAVGSTFKTARTSVTVDIAFAKTVEGKGEGKEEAKQPADKGAAARASARSGRDGLPPMQPCADLEAAYGLGAAERAHMTKYVAATGATPQLAATLAHTMAAVSLSHTAAFDARCAGLNNGTTPQLRSFNASQASLVQHLTTAVSIRAGLVNLLNTTIRHSADPLAEQLLLLWGDVREVRAGRREGRGIREAQGGRWGAGLRRRGWVATKGVGRW